MKVHVASNFDTCNYVYISATPIDYPGGLRFGFTAKLFSYYFIPWLIIMVSIKIIKLLLIYGIGGNRWGMCFPKIQLLLDCLPPLKPQMASYCYWISSSC